MRNRSQFLCAVALAICFTVACANQEDVYNQNEGLMTQDAAIRTALNWMELQYPNYPRFQLKNISKITKDGKITSYQIEFEGGGFAITSANYDSKPIMAYSPTSRLHGDDPLSKEVVSEFSKSVGSGHLAQETIDFNRSFWEKIQSPSEETRRVLAGDTKVEPFITTNWGQSGGYEPDYTYNAATPYVGDGNREERAPVGCAAVAFGQVLKYYNYPKKGVGYKSYCNSGAYSCSDEEKVEAAFYQTNYGWSEMPNSLKHLYSPTPENIEAVSTLLYHIGVAINVKYGYHGSGAKIANESVFSEFKKHFQMGGIERVEKKNHSDDDWYELITAEIKHGRPVILSGIDSSVDAGHAYILDGIQENTGYVHVNWGWSGAANGYFDLRTLIIDGKYSFTENLMAYVKLSPDVVPEGEACNGSNGKRCQPGLVCALNDDIDQKVDEFSSDESGKCLSLGTLDDDSQDLDAGTDDGEMDGGTGDAGEEDPDPTNEPIVESGSVAKGKWIHFGPYQFQTGINVVMTGAGEDDTGDADLYVRRDRMPNQYTFHCRPAEWGTDETCSLTGAGNYFVSIYGYADISEFTLVISSDAP